MSIDKYMEMVRDLKVPEMYDPSTPEGRDSYASKVFAKEKGAMKKKIGVPDLMILFTSTVSHKMVNCAVEEAKKKSIPVCRCHTSSAAALENILKQYCA